MNAPPMGPRVFVLGPTRREAEVFARETLAVRGARCISATGDGRSLEGALIRPGIDRVVLLDATLVDGSGAIRVLLGTMIKNSYPHDQVEHFARDAESSPAPALAAQCERTTETEEDRR
ncbi:hypothetical protein [Oerskovia jenensis]|uniref:hypothetical protein n=1 Tax=Oerskovia jenensis TaxID=162169 RepID=UPI0036D7E52E